MMNVLTDLFTTLLGIPYFALPTTLGIYLGASYLYRRTRFVLFQPVLFSILALALLLVVTKVPYSAYKRGGEMLNFMLGPSVVSIGYLLYKERMYLKGRILLITVAMATGAIVGLISAGGIAWLCGADLQLIASLQPRSVTTPIAMSLSRQAGGIAGLTGVIVVLAGILGGGISPWIFRILKIESKVAKGLALGGSSHGMGTLVALQLGAVEGAFAGLAIGIMGVFTALFTPLITLLWG